MQCSTCTATIPDDSAYCPECGAAIADAGGPEGRDDGQSGQGEPSGTDPARTGGEPTQSAQPNRRQGRSAEPRPQDSPGGERSGAGSQRDADSRVGGQQRAGPPSGGNAAPRSGGNATYAGGPTLGDHAKRLFGRLPWKSGIVGGLLIYGLVFGGFAVLGALDSPGSPLELGTALFIGLVTFVSASDLAFVLAAAVQDVPSELASGAYDGLLGLLYLFVPWLLYATGRKFAQWNDLETDDVLGHVATGMTVVFGTLPLVAILAIAFGADVGHSVVVGGVLVPAIAGGLGGLGVWAFRGQSRSASWGSGIVTALIACVLLLALTFVWAQDGVGFLQNPFLARLLAAIVAFVGVVTLGLVTDGAGLLAYVVVLAPLVAVGYLRASRGPDEGTTVGTGVRAGASLVAGFSTFAFSLLAILTFLQTPVGTEVLALQEAAVFLPESTTGLTQLTGLGDVLHNFAIAVLVVPLVTGGLGGAIAGVVATDRAGQVRSGPHQQPGGGQPQGTTAGRGQTQGTTTRNQPQKKTAERRQPQGSRREAGTSDQSSQGVPPSDGSRKSNQATPEDGATDPTGGETSGENANDPAQQSGSDDRADDRSEDGATESPDER